MRAHVQSRGLSLLQASFYRKGSTALGCSQFLPQSIYNLVALEKIFLKRYHFNKRNPWYIMQGSKAGMEKILYVPYQPPHCLNLGYTCDNLTLERLERRRTSRSCIRRTFDNKGLEYVSQLALKNADDLLYTIKWNAEHNIYLYRITSHLFPWSGEYNVEDLPHFQDIIAKLALAGDVARASGQRITSHPPHYLKLASPNASLVQKSIAHLELQGQILDWMGFAPSHWNKMVVHIGGVYGDKIKSLLRFANSFSRLSPSVRDRLTVENDDRPNSYSVSDLQRLHDMSGIPITFDLHHHKFCSGDLTCSEALDMAFSTWPSDIRPVVHWSESPEDPERAKKSPHAHSCFVYGPLDLYGYEEKVDIMIEAKAREVALMLYRDEIAPHCFDTYDIRQSRVLGWV